MLAGIVTWVLFSWSILNLEFKTLQLEMMPIRLYWCCSFWMTVQWYQRFVVRNHCKWYSVQVHTIWENTRHYCKTLSLYLCITLLCCYLLVSNADCLRLSAWGWRLFFLVLCQQWALFQLLKSMKPYTCHCLTCSLIFVPLLYTFKTI